MIKKTLSSQCFHWSLNLAQEENSRLQYQATWPTYCKFFLKKWTFTFLQVSTRTVQLSQELILQPRFSKFKMVVHRELGSPLRLFAQL